MGSFLSLRLRVLICLSAMLFHQVYTESTESTALDTVKTTLETGSANGTESTIADKGTTEISDITTNGVNENGTTNESTSFSASPSPSPTPPTTLSAVPPISDQWPRSAFFCPCDHLLASCELNCCCDPDCSERRKKTFSACVDEEAFRKYHSSRDSRKCYRRDFLYRNNTLYKTEISQNGLFCVVKENVKKEQEFPAVKINLSKISKQTKSKFSWHVMDFDPTFPQKSAKTFYKYGHQIQMAKAFRGSNNSENFVRIGMVIPASVFGRFCNVKSPIKFLQSQKSSCPFQVSNLTQQCEHSAMLDVATIFPSDSYVIVDPSRDLSNNNIVNFTYMFCPSKTSRCENTTTLRTPTYNTKTSSCDNVLSQMDLIFKHSGEDGITHLMVEIHYANVSSTEKSILQKFSSSFEWENPLLDNMHKHPPRFVSGNPGYIVGKPVLVGSAVPISSQDFGQNKIPAGKVVMDSLQKGALTIHPEIEPLNVLSPPYCGSGKRLPLLFGYDLKVSCVLDFSDLGSCRNLTTVIASVLFGMKADLYTARYVSALGDPHLMRRDNWISWISSDTSFPSTADYAPIDSGCTGVVTSLHLHFFYARVGSVHFPQLKIFAAHIQYGGFTNIPPRRINVTTDSTITVTTTAEFTDITPPPVTPIPKWPIISIRLPQDFFYPFSIATSGASLSRSFTLAIFFGLIRIVLF